MRLPGEYRPGVSFARYLAGLILWMIAAASLYGAWILGVELFNWVAEAQQLNPADRNSYPAQQAQTSSTDFISKGTEILFSQGLSGVFIALLTYILYVTNKQATKERSEHMESVKELWKDNMASTSELATEVKEMHSEFRERLADHSARLQNIEREVEYKRER